MQIDLELYRRDVILPTRPPLRLSVIDIAPEHPHRTMVFIHGFGGQATQWQYQLQMFSAENRVIALDLRGHGRSDRSRDGYAMQQILADLVMVLDVLGVNEKIILAGHSFGGAIVTEFALAYPQRVERLVLIAVARVFRLNWFYSLPLRLPAATLQFLTPFTRHWLKAHPTVLKAWYDSTVAQWDGRVLFPRLNFPTLVIRGHLDVVLAKPLFDEVARLIPNAEEVDVGASGHLVMLERREAVNRAIARFMEGERRMSPSSASIGEGEMFSVGHARSSLMKERPWLGHYEKDVPYTVAVPRVPLFELLSSATRRFGRRTALIFEGRRLSYQRLEQEVNRFANALINLGIKPGDRVILILPNLPQLVVAFYGTLKAGAVAVFTLPTTQPEELIRQICDSGARVLVILTQFDELIAQINKLEPCGQSPLAHVIFTHITDYLPPLKRLVWHLSAERRRQHQLDLKLNASTHAFKPLLAAQSPAAPALEVASRDLAVVQYTGGTTADPKGVMLSHRNLVANTLQTRHWMPGAQEGRERFLSVVPFSHSYGLTTCLNLPLALGASVILLPSFELMPVLRAIRRYRPTIFPGVPQMYVALLDVPKIRHYGIRSIKACLSGSAPLPIEVQEAFEKLTRGRLVEGYGLTEAGPVTHANPLFGLRKYGSIGIPLPSTEARLFDLRTGKRRVPVGHIGELAVRGPQVMLGYWQDKEANDRVLTPDGWLLTGDVAQMDSDGYFRIIARKADMWYPNKPAKQPAFPRDVEEVLFEIPQVKEAAVVAVAGRPIAFVIGRRERLTGEAVIAYCRRRLPPELVPRLVIFVDDFPRTFIGKVLRRELARRVPPNP